MIAVRLAPPLAAAGLTALLIDVGPLGFHWLPLMLGLTLLVAALSLRSRGPLWGSACVLIGVGAVVAAWFSAGRSGNDYELVPLVSLGLGTGALVVSLLARPLRLELPPTSIALPVLAFGLLALLDQKAGPLQAQHAWPYALGVALFVLVASRVAPTSSRAASG